MDMNPVGTSKEAQVPVKVAHRTNADLFYISELHARSLSASERAFNSAKSLGLWWLAAVAFVFVPVLHFFLVPLALLAGLVLFYHQMRLTTFHEAANFECPSCKAAIEMKAQAFNWPVRSACMSCRTSVIVTPLNP